MVEYKDLHKEVYKMKDAVVFGWLTHYFEESSIEGILYNEDGTEYKKSTPVKKTTSKPTNIVADDLTKKAVCVSFRHYMPKK